MADRTNTPRRTTPVAADNGNLESPNVPAQFIALKAMVLEAVESWNQSHPHRLPSHRETASFQIRQHAVGKGSLTAYSIAIECKLVSAERMTFHGPNLAYVAERARFTVQQNIERECRAREQQARDDAAFMLER